MLCGDLNGKEIQTRGNTCICIADSLCCAAETNTLWSKYTPIKINKKRLMGNKNTLVRIIDLKSTKYNKNAFFFFDGGTIDQNR